MPHVLVTGANRGIGLELARQLATRGDHVIASCRTASPELADLARSSTGRGFGEVRVESGIDLRFSGDIANLADRLASAKLDVVVHNAGILSEESISDFDVERIRKQFEVNALAPIRLTLAVLERLEPGAKIAFITSRMGSLSDNTSGGFYGYRMSKAALNMAAISLAHDLRPRNIAVALVHPGYVRTQMTDFQGNIDPAQAAARLIARIDALDLESTGQFWHAEGSPLPW